MLTPFTCAFSLLAALSRRLLLVGCRPPELGDLLHHAEPSIIAATSINTTSASFFISSPSALRSSTSSVHPHDANYWSSTIFSKAEPSIITATSIGTTSTSSFISSLTRVHVTPMRLSLATVSYSNGVAVCEVFAGCIYAFFVLLNSIVIL